MAGDRKCAVVQCSEDVVKIITPVNSFLVVRAAACVVVKENHKIGRQLGLHLGRITGNGRKGLREEVDYI